MTNIYRGFSLASMLFAIMFAGSGQAILGLGMLGLCFVLSVMSEE